MKQNLDHNHKNLLGGVIPTIMMFLGSSVLLTIPIFDGFQDSTIIVIGFGLALLAGGIIMLKGVLKTINDCPACL